jgi:hypothetical protein
VIYTNDNRRFRVKIARVVAVEITSLVGSFLKNNSRPRQ